MSPRTMLFVLWVLWPTFVTGIVLALRPQELPRIEICGVWP